MCSIRQLKIEYISSQLFIQDVYIIKIKIKNDHNFKVSLFLEIKYLQSNRHQLNIHLLINSINQLNNLSVILSVQIKPHTIQ